MLIQLRLKIYDFLVEGTRPTQQLQVQSLSKNIQSNKFIKSTQQKRSPEKRVE